MEGGGSCVIYWPWGRGLPRAWALKQGNRVTEHSVRLKDADNPIIAAMKS